MPTLTQNQIEALEDDLESSNVAGFYARLQSYGDDYGSLGLAVTNNEGWQAQISNGFVEERGEEAEVDMSYGSEDWQELNASLAEGYLAAYVLNGNATPDWEAVQQLHEVAYTGKGLQANDWLPNALLNNSGDPAALWADLLVSEGAADLWQNDLWNVLGAGAGPLFGPYLAYAALADASALDPEKMAFAKALINALANMDETGLADMLLDFTGNGDVEALLELLLGLPGAPVDPAANLPSNDSPWSPHRLIPDWIQDALDAFEDAKNASSPLVLDLDGDGIELAALSGTGSVYWDIDLDGFSEATGWIAGGDGLLAIDLDDDGVINDNAELFGDQTGSPNGFAALAAYDSNSSGTITSADAQWVDLLVWVDANADGYSQSGEQHTLDSLGITSISLGYSNVNYDIAGNAIKQESTFVIGGSTRTIVDAWFTYDDTNTVYSGEYTIDPRTLFLPTLRGFGNLPDLHVAMSLDETLLEMVQEVAVADVGTLISAAFDVQGKLQAIMYRWAGVDGVGPTSRGVHIDARKIEFLEELVGREWIDDGSPNPNSGPATVLLQTFNEVRAALLSVLLSQTDAKQAFGDDAYYNPVTGEIEGFDLGKVWFLGQTAAQATGTSASDIYLWNSGDGADTILDSAGAEDALQFGSGIVADDLRLRNPNNGTNDLYILLGGVQITIDDQFAGSGKVVERAVFADGSILDLLNNLTFRGTTGNDSIHALADNNTLRGLAGNDDLYGYAGNDTYLWSVGDGTDVIYDTAGTDTLQFGAGIVAADIRLWNPNNGTGNLHVYVGSTYLIVADQFDGAGKEVETATFAGGGTLGLLNNLSFTGTASSENVYGVSDNNVLKGLAGHDNLYGQDGNDVLWGGTGWDTLSGGNGADTFAWLSGDLDGSLDTLSDFSVAGGDKFNLADLLSGYDPLTELISNFVRFTEGASSTTLYVDTSGTGTFSAANDVATISGVTNILAGGSGTHSTETDLQTMITNGMLIVA